MTDEALKIGDLDVSIAELAGLDTEQIAAKKGTAFPAGIFGLRCAKAELKVVGAGESKKPAISFDFECRNVHELAVEGGNAEEAIGRHHFEVVTIDDVLEDIGHVKAFMADAGYTGTGSLQDILADFEGTDFRAKIKQRPKKDDPDIIYSNIGLKFGFWKVWPGAEVEEQSTV